MPDAWRRRRRPTAPFSLPGWARASVQQLGDILGRQIGAHDQQHRIDADRRHGHEIGADVVRHMFVVSAGAIVVEPFEASMMTLPSGGALATEAAAISPLAPARFSTTTERSSRSPMPGATMQAPEDRSGRRAESPRRGAADDRGNLPPEHEDITAVVGQRQSGDAGKRRRGDEA